MNDHLSVGIIGEQCAASFLESCGYHIVDTNVRTKFGELDIIAQGPDGALAIVEVKTLSRLGSISPEDNLTRSKFIKLSRMANFYANKHPELVSLSFGWRIDLIAVTLSPTSGSPSYNFGKINFAAHHYQNISL